MDKRLDNLIENWQKRNIFGLYCDNKEEALVKILEIIPQAATVGISGSVTLEEIGIVKALEARGNKVINQYKAGISKEESLELRKESILADYYLASANAISQEGELVFLSAYGNRTSGISYAKNVIVVCGINKITANLEKAIKRAKEVATPLNYKRLNWDASRPMRCQILIIEAEVNPDRLKVILVGENLGF
jgi:L-lactate utilization protein LutB